MAKQNEQFTEMNRKSMDAALKLAQMSFDNAQRMMALQSDLAKEIFQSGMANAKAQASASDPQALMQLRTQYAQTVAQRMMATAQQMNAVSESAKNEFTRLVQEQMASGSPDMTAAMQSFLKGMPNSGQGQNMMEAFQQAMSQGKAAMEQFTQASADVVKKATSAAKKPAAKAKRR